METERITLSQRERDRLKVLHEVKQKHLAQVAAAQRLKVTDRQVRRMLLRIRERGDSALVHGLRGRPSNRKLAARFEQKIGAPAPALCRFRTHAGRRAPGPRGFPGEPADAAEMDDQGGFVASALPAREGRACVERAQSLFRRTGDAGQLSVPLAGGSRSGLPAHRPDR